MTITPGAAQPGAGVSAAQAAGAYGSVDGGDFGAALARAGQTVIDAGHKADAASLAAVAGQGNLTDLVGAVSRADLALQATVAIRDRVVQAYQEIMRMPI
jgi:flagellar hook-basal body complex protein FliE